MSDLLAQIPLARIGCETYEGRAFLAQLFERENLSPRTVRRWLSVDITLQTSWDIWCFVQNPTYPLLCLEEPMFLQACVQEYVWAVAIQVSDSYSGSNLFWYNLWSALRIQYPALEELLGPKDCRLLRDQHGHHRLLPDLNPHMTVQNAQATIEQLFTKHQLADSLSLLWTKEPDAT